MKSLILIVVIYIIFNNNKVEAQTAYFIINTESCGLCVINSINIHKNQLKEFDINIVLNKEDKSLIDFLQERINPDSIIFNSNDTFKDIKIMSLNDMMIFNNDDILISHIPNFTVYKGHVNISNKILKNDIKIKDINLFSILYPKIENDIITTIDPRRGHVFLLKNFNNEYIELYEEYSTSKNEKYYFYPQEDTTIQELWDDFYGYYPDFIEYYSVIKSSSDSIYTISKIFHHFDIDTNENNATTIFKTAIIRKYKNDSTKVDLLGFDDEYSLKVLQPNSNVLNDSLSILNLVNRKSKNHNLAFVNSINNNIAIMDTSNSFIYSKNVFYLANINEIIVYNIDSNAIRKYSYNDSKLSTLNTKLNFLNSKWSNEIFDILVHKDEIVIIYSNVIETNTLYLERYNIEDFSFIEGRNLDCDLSKINEMIFAGVSNGKLYLFNKDINGVWNLSFIKI